MVYLITFSNFESVVAENLTADDVKKIQSIKRTMSKDRYAGYSPEEQIKRRTILEILGNKVATVITV